MANSVTDSDRELAREIVNALNETCVLTDLEGTHLGFDPDNGYSLVADLLARYREQLRADRPFCEEEKDSFICNLKRGHEGDHKDMHHSGGCVGWRAKLERAAQEGK